MAEIAAWKIPDIDNVPDAAIEEAWRDWAVIEMGKRCGTRYSQPRHL